MFVTTCKSIGCSKEKVMKRPSEVGTKLTDTCLDDGQASTPQPTSSREELPVAFVVARIK